MECITLCSCFENTDARVSKEGGFCYEFHILHRLLALAVTQCRVFGCTNELEERREATVRLPMGRCFQPRPHLPFDAQVSSNRAAKGDAAGMLSEMSVLLHSCSLHAAIVQV